jgi:hypothetical protein
MNMQKRPEIEAHMGTESDPSRVDWLRAIYFAATRNLLKRGKKPYYVCFWPGSIVKMEERDEILTVYWWDTINMRCFRWAFDAAWAAHGDTIKIIHRAFDEMSDEELAPFEVLE